MTIKAVEWALRREGISATAKLVLVMLCDCINASDEVAFPSQKRISEVVGRKERQVRRHIDSLEQTGLIAVIPGAGAGRGKGRQPDRYAIACDHRTGQDRALSPEIIAKCGSVTAGHLRPAVGITGGHNGHAVTVTAGHFEHPVRVTGGHLGPLQAVISGNAYIEEPEIEPEIEHNPESETLFPLTLSPAPPTTKAKLDGAKAIEMYNEAAKRCGWCVAKGEPSAARKAAIRARLREHGMEGWAAQIARAEQFPFLGGDSDTGWRMGIDYFVRPSGWAKIAEGSLPRRQQNLGNRNDNTSSDTDPGVRRRERSPLTDLAMRLMSER